jgi:iron complex outermembrane receptor protein
MQFKPALPAVLVLSALSSPLHADNNTTLEPIVVSSSRLNLSQHLPANVTVISREQIQNSAERTLPELLSRFAGINTTSYYNHGASGSIDIRGFGTTAGQNTLILLDGRRLNEIDLSGVNYAAIPYENIDRIEVIRGSGAVLYGDGAAGGVVNIITRSPDEAGSYSKISGTLGSENHRTANAFASLNTDTFGLTANINTTHDDGYRDNNKYRQNSGQMDFRLPLDGNEFYAKVGSYTSHIQYPGTRNYRPRPIASFLGVQPVDLSLINDRKGTDTPDDKAWERVTYSNVGYTAKLNEQTSLVLDGGYRQKDSQAEFASYASTSDTDYTVYSFTPRLINDQTLAFGSLNTTLGMDWYTHNYNGFSTSGDRKIDQKNQAFYWQSSLSIHDKTIITAGIRTDAMRFDGRNITSATELDKRERENSYELGIRQFLDENWSVYARTGENTRFANVDEQVGVFGGITDLAPQTARTNEIGASYVSAGFSGDISLFYQNLTDEIRYNPITFANENLDKTRRKGVEVTTRFALNDWLDMNANYTYLSAKFRDGDLDGNTLPLVPEHQFNVGLAADLPYQTHASVNWHYVSNSYFVNDLNNDFGRKIPSYQTVDFKISKQLNKLELSLSVNNLFDEKYYNFATNGSAVNGNFNAYPLAERTAYVSASYLFD